MRTITTVETMKEWGRRMRYGGKVIGFIPTMGCLHKGHLSLVEASISECDYTVVSIFINPTQFSPSEDLELYPRNIKSDEEKLRNAGVDILFYPECKDLYPENFQTFVEVEDKAKYLCGKSRPGFFRGATTIILKLFNILNPHVAFFGEKDRQQLEVVRTMVRDLDLDVIIVGKPIIRERDGLAMSSRNQYLSVEDRISALSLSKALKAAQILIMEGERSAETIRTEIRRMVEKSKKTKVDYISVCDSESFMEQKKISLGTLIAIAVQVGKARLIDNCIIKRT